MLNTYLFTLSLYRQWMLSRIVTFRLVDTPQPHGGYEECRPSDALTDTDIRRPAGAVEDMRRCNTTKRIGSGEWPE